MKPRTRFTILALIPLGCATGENTGTGDIGLGGGGTSTDSAGAGGSAPGTSGNAMTAGTGTAGTGTAGTSSESAGTFSNAGTFNTAGSGTGGGATGGTGGTGSAGTATAGTTSSAGKSSGGAAGTNTGTAGTNAAGGTGPVTAYCDSAAKSPLPYKVNDGFQPSGWQGDTTAVNAAPANPDGCAVRAAGSVGDCTTWKFTPNATTPLWAGVTWSKVWDANYTHPPVCLATGATKVTFQAKGAQGGEVVTFSAAGAAEIPFTLTNAWKEYAIPLNGVQYNTFAEGVTSGFFWKVAPPTPNGAPVTFFVDDIQFFK